ncbi:MAG: ABC transporter permease [Cyclobacteriaceae bacterium]
MIRAFTLEWLKLKNYRIFWLLFGIYLLGQLVITNGGIFLLEWLKQQGADIEGLDPTMIPIYDFPDIWQNTAWLGSFVKILIAFIMVISVNNDLTYNTMRQNIIDGVSKKEFILSKFALILFLSAICTLVLFVSGLITGFIYSSVTELKYVFDELEYMLAYFYQLVVFSMLAFLVALIIKKAGFAIVLLFLYSTFLEPITTAILQYADPIKDSTQWLAKFFPVYAINNLIDVPFPRYILREIQDNILWHEWLIATAWMAIFTSLIVFILNKRDLKA